MARARITLLGGFAAFVEGEALPDNAWRLRKARDLVKLLALADGHRLHREQAMDALWRERDPASAANNLHQAVHAARRALGATAIDVRDELIRLLADVDVDEFEQAVGDARRIRTPAAYRAALTLYAGELLPENRYDDWATARRTALTELHAGLLDELDRLGPVDALPGLPAPTSSFVGRDRELGELRALLARTRLLTLTGTGGAGKTRLALELARESEHSFASGALLVELASVVESRRVVDAAATALDVRALPGRSVLEASVDFLRTRSLLLVLDNCEHLLGPTASLADALLRGAPDLTVVATSREPLGLPGEVVFRVPSLAIPHPDQHLTPGDLLSYEAVRMFVERATEASPGFVLDASNAGDVVRICFRLDGLPLALELAAGRLGALGPASVAERLDGRFRLLRSRRHSAPTRQQTLAATIDWSHDLLEPDERLLFRRLAAFADGFGLAAVEEVCAGDGLEARDIAETLARLVEKSLVSADDGTRERRYRLLETVRLYAGERLDDAGETEALAERHAWWACSLAAREREASTLDREAANLRLALDTLLAEDPTEALRACVVLLPFWLRRIDLSEGAQRLADALAAAPERTAVRADALVAAAAIDMRSGTLDTGRARVKESLEIAAESGRRQAEWRALHFLGGFGIASDDGEEAIRWFDRGLNLARAERLPAEEATCIYALGIARWTLGDVAAADELVSESIVAFRALADSPARVPAPINIGELRDSSPAGVPLRIVFEETLEPLLEISCDAAVSYALVNQGGIARIRGDLTRARALLDESDERFARAHDERGRADVQARRAYLELAQGSVDAGRSCMERALRLRRGLNDVRGVGLALAGLCLIDIAAGDLDEAEAHVSEACDIFRRAGDRWGLASALWRAADLGFARGRLEEAEAALDEAMTVVAETGRDRWTAHTLAGRAEVAAARGDLQRAAALFAEARDLYAGRTDAAAVAHVDERLRSLAKPPQRARKGRASTPSSRRNTRREGGTSEHDSRSDSR